MREALAKMTRQSAQAHLLALAERLFRLPECLRLEIRQVTIRREDWAQPDTRESLVEEAMDASWHDAYSDIDMTIGIRELRQQPLDWLRRAGVDETHCLGFFAVPESGACRVVFRDGHRYDLSIAPQTEPRQPLPVVDNPEHPHWPRAAVNRFWFVQVQALGKLYRQDYLIARHLAHMQLNETLVQQMVLRDLRLGTNHHRYGGKEAAVYQQYAGQNPLGTGEAAFDEIASQLYCAAQAYDELTRAFYPDDAARTPVYLNIWQQYEQHRLENQRTE